MKISIESISFSQEMINFMTSNNLILESLDISVNNHFDLIISGKFIDLYDYLIKFGYIDEYQDKEMIIGDLELYLVD